MTDERKDLEEILRYSAIEHDRRIELLTKYLDALTNAYVKETDWLIASALLWVSVMRANSDLNMIKLCTHYAPGNLAEAGRQLQAIVPLIQKLRARLPERISKFDEIVSYGTHSERSWMMIAISAANWFTVPYLELTSEIAKSLSEAFEYDPHYVGLHLEIEKRKFERIHFYPNDGGDETAIGDALDRLLRDTVKADAQGPLIVETDYSEPLPKEFVAKAFKKSVDWLREQITEGAVRIHPNTKRAAKKARFHIDTLPDGLKRPHERTRLLEAFQRGKPT